MNLAIIFSEAICLNSTDKKIRKILAGIFCSFFYLIQLFFTQLIYLQWMIAFCTMIIAFGKTNFKNIIKQVLFFYFISFLYGGTSFALMSMINKGKFFIFNGVIIGKFGLKLILVSGILAFGMISMFLNKRKKHVFRNIVITIGEKKVEIRVLLDTGNLLREPYKNRPVVIIEKSAIEDLIVEILRKKEIAEKKNNSITFDIDLILKGQKEIPDGMFLIPYRSIGNNGGMLLGIVPDYIMIKESGRKYENIVIGICSDCLSESGEYNGIFGLESLNEGSV